MTTRPLREGIANIHMRKLAQMRRALLMFLTIACLSHPAISAETDTKHDINRIAFITPKEWLLVRPLAISKDGQLLFRRYGIKIGNLHGDLDPKPDSFELQYLDPPGTLINVQLFNCPRDGQYANFLTVHLPETVGLRSFDLKDWQSKLQIRTLADGNSRALEGEFIKGDLFIGADRLPFEDFLRLLDASRTIVEFGDKNDRILFIVEDQFGRARIKDFLRDVLPERMNWDVKALRYFNTREMITACLDFRRNGSVPKFRER